jgi:CubicO group peptidase (beta-lactamase class C family)
MHMKNRTALLALAITVTAAHAAEKPLPKASPQAHGYSPERLERLHDAIQERIERGEYAGAVSLIARDGKTVDWKAYGYRDLELRDAMETNDIFRIYSMTKVMVSAAALILLEEGEFLLGDPVSKYIPEMVEVKVHKGGKGDALELEELSNPITIRHLFTHTSGLAYDFSAPEELKPFYQAGQLFEQENGEAFIRELVKIPLVHQPGERMTYGVSTDVLGRLIEVVSGQSLGGFMKERLFDPLGMADTGFTVPAEKLDRLALLYTTREDELVHLVPDEENWFNPPVDGSCIAGFESGGGGLYSTAGDYLRFGQMLLNGGELDGVRILSRKSIEIMTANQLEGLEDPTHMYSESDGFGLGVSVRESLARGDLLGSIGQYGWSGAATTYFNADPKERTVVLLLVQHMPYDQHGIFPFFNNLHYQAIID